MEPMTDDTPLPLVPAWRRYEPTPHPHPPFDKAAAPAMAQLHVKRKVPLHAWAVWRNLEAAAAGETPVAWGVADSDHEACMARVHALYDHRERHSLPDYAYAWAEREPLKAYLVAHGWVRARA